MERPIMNFQIAILYPLGSGGNGDVFVGQRSDNAELVVVKYLRNWHLPLARRAFEREVRVLSQRLRGLVHLVLVDLKAQPPFYVMPYLRRGALTQYAGRLADDQLHNAATELASTVATLHAANETHGDIKPDNILVSRDGQLRLADPLGNGTLFTMLFSQNRGGTPGYCAPEIVAGGSISPQGDVFSYGATLYHLQAGRRPQPGQRLHVDVQGYTSAPKIREVIVACCQLDPNARPTALEVLRVLRGERWADIQAERAQRKALGVTCLIGVAIVAALTLRPRGSLG